MAVKSTTTIQRIYDELHVALWASLITGALYFLTVVVPQLPAKQAEIERQREQAVAAENVRYCERWGMPAGTRRNMECTVDLSQLRAKIEQETTDLLTF